MSMREDFEAAIETSGVEEDDDQILEETQQVVEVAEEPAPSIEGAESEEATTTRSDTEHDYTEKVTADKSEQKAEDHDSLKAPLDWSPKQRESWSKVPRQIQDKIVAREQEMAQSMQGTAEARKSSERFNQLANSYAPVIAAEGVNTPMEAVEGMFKTAANLRMGTPDQKAQQIAQMIKHYGVDIQALDNVLVGQPAQVNPNAQIEQMLDQRMAPINQVMQQLNDLQGQKQQKTQQDANQSVADFGQQAEFMNDVRNDMADLIDMSVKQGRNLTLQQAYDRACMLNPEISQILDERKKNEQIMGGRTSLAAKRSAASTLNGKMSGAGGGGGVMSIRDTIASAWDESGQ